MSIHEKLSGGKDYYEIRLESIGGLGANLCGKMLGEVGLKYLNLNSSSFASYGSEKTGTPVKGFIRYCIPEKEIRVHYPVINPDLLVVFHEALLSDEGVWKGCHKDTSVIIAVNLPDHLSDKEVAEEGGGGCDCRNMWQNILAPDVYGRIKSVGACYVLDAQKIAMETHSRINVVMLGATLKVMGVEDIEIGRKICTDTLGKKYPDALANNIAGMERGYQELTLIAGLEVTDTDCDCGEMYDCENQCSCESDASNTEREQSGKIGRKEEWGYENAPLGGINPRFGSTVEADLSASRQGYIPLFIKERCINCGLCHSTCPDMVFQFAKGEYKGKEMMVNQGLDYYHCKGCLRCVDVCPVNALVRGVEAEHPDKEFFLPNQELLYTPDYYEKAGPDGYITSESYLTEKRMEGGEV